MDIVNFITQNATMVIIVGIIVIMTIIGYIADKTGFGKKFIEKNKNKDEIEKEELKHMNLNRPLIEKSESNDSNTTINSSKNLFDSQISNLTNQQSTDSLVHQNLNVSNEQANFSEDLYVPFGDEDNDSVDSNSDVEKFSSENSFEQFDNNDGVQNLNSSLSSENTNLTSEIINQDVILDNSSVNENGVKEPKYVDEVNKIVNDTHIENNDVKEEQLNIVDESIPEDSFEISGSQKPEENQSNIEKINSTDDVLLEDDSTKDETSDFDIDETTTLKLDEINEKIRNLKLEDLDNNDDSVMNKDTTKSKKVKKNVSIKSIDDILKEKVNQETVSDEQLNNNEIEPVNELAVNEDVSNSNDNELQSFSDNSENDIWNF